MVVKLSSKQVPAGFQRHEFRYVGAVASEQGEFGPEIGIVDMVPIDERGIANPARYFHIGVVEARGQWFLYMEWGWTDAREPGFMFVRCRDEQDARRYFRRQCVGMNVARIEHARGGWQARAENAWLVHDDARERGLPQRRMPASEPIERACEAEVVRLADWQPSATRVDAMVRGLVHDARLAAQASGIVPTLELLEQVADELRPLVVQRIAELSSPHPSLLARAAGLATRSRGTLSAAAN
ncbi:hypothetical protein ACNOYE_17805 [Nannocystaceae bacterium ST9]